MFEHFTTIFMVSSITSISLGKSFLGCATEIWNTTKLDDIHSTVCQSWTELASGMQRIICDV